MTREDRYSDRTTMDVFCRFDLYLLGVQSTTPKLLGFGNRWRRGDDYIITSSRAEGQGPQKNAHSSPPLLSVRQA